MVNCFCDAYVKKKLFKSLDELFSTIENYG